MEIGVVIGRFQVESLHDGHRFLVNKAFENHRKVIIFIGCPPIEGTKHDPLDFVTRLRMLQSEYPDAIILPQHDRLSDEEWSERLDEQIKGVVPNVTTAILYGGRKSFQPHYKGKYTAIEIDSGINYKNASEQRGDIGKVTRSSADFRAGIIYSTQNAWPYVKMCVDMALIKNTDTDGTKLKEVLVLLGRKASENKWRLPGGMVDKGETLEQSAARELREETNTSVEIAHLDYIGSFPVGDWRFKNAGEIGLMTALFGVEYLWGAPAPKHGSDLVEVKWFPLINAEKAVVNAHKPLIKAAQRRYEHAE